MIFTTTLTQKGQITIPKKIREFLDLHLNEKIEIKMQEKTNTIALNPLPKLSDLAGSFSVKNPKNPIKIREYMQTNYKQA